jgi:hypothetical protein
MHADGLPIPGWEKNMGRAVLTTSATFSASTPETRHDCVGTRVSMDAQRGPNQESSNCQAQTVITT